MGRAAGSLPSSLCRRAAVVSLPLQLVVVVGARGSACNFASPGPGGGSFWRNRRVLAAAVACWLLSGPKAAALDNQLAACKAH